MKEIRAIIRPQKLPRLREVLRSMPGFPGMTVSKAFGCGSTCATHRRTSRKSWWTSPRR
jgi:nitrogen regulatory protein PII